MNGAMVLRRGLSTTAQRMSAAAHPSGGMKLWKNLTFFMALPAIGVMAVNVFLHMKKEWECPPPRPEFIPYDHLRIRNKRFPWGDGNKSLFHNPHVNALPNGYEDHDEEH